MLLSVPATDAVVQAGFFCWLVGVKPGCIYFALVSAYVSGSLECLLSVFCYPRDAMLARLIAIATCLSVRLSVTRRYCVKTKKASVMISSPSGSPKTLVF